MPAAAFQHGSQVENWPLFIGAAERTRQKSLAAGHGGWRVAGKLTLGEASEAQYLIDEQPSRNFAMIYDDDARIAGERCHSTSKKLAQVNDRQQLTPHIGETLDPGLGARYTGHARGNSQHLACFFPRHQVKVAGHPQRDADPFAPRRAFRAHLRRHGATPPLQLG
jgi:hypothetical protein